MTDGDGLKAWSDISSEEQSRLREAFGRMVDEFPQMRVCDWGEKNRLFTDFLAQHAIRWPSWE